MYESQSWSSAGVIDAAPFPAATFGAGGAAFCACATAAICSDTAVSNAPHTAHVVTADAWDKPYSRETAAWPLEYLRRHKFWPAVGRIDNAYGDRNLVCACPPVSAYTS